MKGRLNYLPLGSIVYIKGGAQKIMIVARGLQVNVQGTLHYFDYGGCLYPNGLMGDQVMYFQHDDILDVVFEGFSDKDDEIMVKNIQDAYQSLDVKRPDIKGLKKSITEA